MTPRSPVTTVPSPIEIRQVRQGRTSNGTILALLVMVAVYGLAGWLMLRPKAPATARAAQVAVQPPAPVRKARRDAGESVTVAPAVRADLDRHPCAACEP